MCANGMILAERLVRFSATISPTMPVEQIPWWLDRLTLAAFTLVGAGIGFAADRFKDWLDARAAKHAFLKAIRLELVALREQLEASLTEVDAGRSRFAANKVSPPQFAATFRTTVFSTQLGKLSDLSDPLIMALIKFYSDIPMLERIIELLNRKSGEAFKATTGVQQTTVIVEILSMAQILREQLSGFLRQIDRLLPKLPDENR